VDEFMNNLEEHPYWRANYGITDDPSLFQVTLSAPMLFSNPSSSLSQHLTPLRIWHSAGCCR